MKEELQPDAGYRSAFFETYYSTHVAHRKGPPSLANFRTQAKVWRKVFASLIPRDKTARIADVGCGTGSLVWWLQQEGYQNAQGIDVSPEQVAIATKLGVRNVRQDDLLAFLQSQSGSQDVLVFRDVLEHFTKGEILTSLTSARETLRVGGRVILHVPNAESPFGGRIRYGDFTHEIAFTRSSLIQLLTVCGFSNVVCHPSPPIATTLASTLRMPLWWLVQSLYRVLIFAELGRSASPILTQGIIAVAFRAGTDSR